MLSRIITSVGRIVDITRYLWRGVGTIAVRQKMPESLRAHVFGRIQTAAKGLFAILARFVRFGPGVREVPVLSGPRKAAAPRPLWGVTEANPFGSPRSFGWILPMAQSKPAERIVRSLCWMMGVKYSQIGQEARWAEARAVAAWQGPAVAVGLCSIFRCGGRDRGLF